MEPTHTLDLSRLRHLETLKNNARAVVGAAGERLKELHEKLLKVESRITDAKKIAKGESSFYPDESVAWQDTRAIRKTWSERVEALQKELDELEGQMEVAQAEYSKAGEESNAAISLLDQCKKFLANQRQDEVEAQMASIKADVRARASGYGRIADV